MIRRPPRSTLFPYTNALPISTRGLGGFLFDISKSFFEFRKGFFYAVRRSEEHTSELQSHVNLVCRLLLEKKKKNSQKYSIIIYISLQKVFKGIESIAVRWLIS